MFIHQQNQNTKFKNETKIHGLAKNKQCKRRRRTKAAREEEREKSSFAAFCRENDDQSRPGRLDQRLKNLVQAKDTMKIL